MIRPETTALVHDWVTVPGGAEEVLREIVQLFPGTVFTAQFNPARFKWLDGVPVRDTWVSRMPFSRQRHYLYAPILADVYARMDLSGFKLILTDSHTFAHHVRKPEGAVHLCYYHTPARSLWAPEVDDRAGSDPLRKMIAKRLRRLDLLASKNPDVLFANSQTTANRIRKAYGREVEEVIYPPVETSKWIEVERRSDRLGFLVWGRLIRYKRFDLAIEAARTSGFPLQIVGAGPLESSLKQLAAGASNVTFHGRIDDEQLRQLMSECRGVLFPGYEDFGIVPVEAMAAGLPVAAYGEGGASETVTPECGVQFTQQSQAALAGAVKSLESREFDPAVLKARALEFDTQVFRRKYRAAVERHAN